MQGKKKKTAVLRSVVQISTFVLVALIAVGKWLAEKGTVIPFFSEMSLHGVCPFGGVVTLNELFTEGSFIQKIHSSSVVLMLLGFVVAILFGNIFCGYICPFGTFQEWLGSLGRKLFPKSYNHIVPEKLDRGLRWLRYGVLGLVVYQTAVTGKLIFQSVDPYYALFNFFTGEVALTAFAVLAAVMLLSLIVERPWCRYFCPYGALLGLFNTVRIFKLRRNKSTCISCGQCDRACPMNIKVSKKGVVRDPACISCHKCTSAVTCPVADTVVITSEKAIKEGIQMKLKPQTAVLITLTIFIIGIFTANALGLWSALEEKVPEKLTEAEFAGEYDPEDIRGSFTFSEISTYYSIPIEDLAAAFGVESAAADFRCKELETIYMESEEEIGTGSVKMFVAFYQGLPYEPTEDTWLPQAAADILADRGAMTDGQLEYLAAHTIFAN